MATDPSSAGGKPQDNHQETLSLITQQPQQNPTANISPAAIDLQNGIEVTAAPNHLGNPTTTLFDSILNRPMPNNGNTSPYQYQHPHDNLEARNIATKSIEHPKCPKLHQLVECVLPEAQIGKGKYQSIGNDAGIGTEFPKGQFEGQNITTIQENVAANSQIPAARRNATENYINNFKEKIDGHACQHDIEGSRK